MAFFRLQMRNIMLTVKSSICVPKVICYFSFTVVFEITFVEISMTSFAMIALCNKQIWRLFK